MSQPLCLITHRFDPHLKLKLNQFSEGEFVYKKNLFEDEDSLKKCKAIICRTSLKVDSDFLNKCENLKYLVTATSGFDHIDLSETQKRKIQCFHVPEAQSEAAAEMTFLLMFATARRWTRASQQVRSGDWQRELLMGHQLKGKNLGIIGLGRVGQSVAQKAKAFGLNVFTFDPYIESSPEYVKRLGFEELMRTCDIVTLHVPKTKTTRHMINKETLSWMNSEACLLNLSRGDVVHEEDLIEHLVDNSDFRVGLDVFKREPLSSTSSLFNFSNVVLSPHIGASTQEALRASSEGAVEKVRALFKGEAVSTGELPPKAEWWGD